MVEALRWLLDFDGTAPSHLVFLRARISGLGPQSSSENWNVDGHRLTQAFGQALRRLPSDPAALALIVHGLGELQARCHAELVEPLAARLRAGRPNRKAILRLLAGVLDSSRRIAWPVNMQALATAQALARGTLDWELLHAASQYVVHPSHLSTDDRYGLKFATRVVLRLDPRSLARWIADASVIQALAAVARAGVEDLWLDRDGTAHRLARTGNALFKAAAAAILCLDRDEQGPHRSYREIHRILVKEGVATADAIWLAGLQLKEAVHERYRRNGGCGDQLRHLDFLRAHPERAVGGVAYAADEIDRLTHLVNEHGEGAKRCAATLERILTDMAACWPGRGLSAEQMAWLEPAFVDTPEIRHRMAEKLFHTENRKALLKRNVDAITEEIGLDRKDDKVFDEFFRADRDRFIDKAAWCAKSLIALYDQDNKGPGRRAGQLVGPLADRAQALLGKPFIAARQPNRCRSAIGRSIAADLFALAVVAETPDDRRDDVDTLRRHAIDHAFAVLRSTGGQLDDQDCSDGLARIAIAHLDADRLTDWIAACDLPPVVRAHALWTHPDRIASDPDLAQSLFLLAAKPPVSPHAARHHFQLVACLLDAAMAAAARAGAFHLLDELEELWKQVAPAWQPILDARWADLAGMIARALKSEGPDRNYILSDHCFANSATKGWLLHPG